MIEDQFEGADHEGDARVAQIRNPLPELVIHHIMVPDANQYSKVEQDEQPVHERELLVVSRHDQGQIRQRHALDHTEKGQVDRA
ncbi:MAG TPA: hypothetical protein VEL49_06485 [Ktedonobacteraceae bacterium]|nr:hypothetical protein [Ktedonobacteraceae bacterium]